MTSRSGEGAARVAAKARFDEAFRLDDAGRAPDAIAAFSELWDQFGQSDDPQLRVLAARSLVNIGVTYGELGDVTRESQIYRQAVSAFESDDHPEVKQEAARALLFQAVALAKQDQHTEALNRFDDILSEYGGGPSPSAQLQFTLALSLRGIAEVRRSQGKIPDSISAYRNLVQRFHDVPEPEVRDEVSNALAELTYWLLEAEEPEAVLGVYEDFVEHGEFKDRVPDESLVRVAVQHADALVMLGRHREGLLAYEMLVATIEVDDPALNELVTAALANQGSTLLEMGLPEEALSAYDLALQLAHEGTHLLAATVSYNRANALVELDRFEEALTGYDEVIALYDDSASPDENEPVALALSNKGIELDRRGETQEASRTFEILIERFAHAPVARKEVAQAVRYLEPSSGRRRRRFRFRP